jgi:cyclophilin family peptidyl-prolyl cis-trans isomerase/Tfp pilus assembly protein PilF
MRNAEAQRGNDMKTQYLFLACVILTLAACGPLTATAPEATEAPTAEPAPTATVVPTTAPVAADTPESSAGAASVDELLIQGNQQIGQGAWEAAEETYKEVLGLDAESILAHSALAYIYAQQGRMDEAITEGQTVLELAPDDFASHANLAMLYLQKGDTDSAISAAEKAVELAPEQERAGLFGFFVQQGLLEEEPVPTMEPGQRAGDLEPSKRNRIYPEPPPMAIDPDKTYQATIVTDKGEIVIELYADRAPNTVNSFVFLAREGFYDDTTFHRVLPDFMAQGGDPTGTGSGGPGYSFADEFHPELRHDGPGVLSMANSGPGTNGSQFFITFDATPWLDDQHAVFGRVIEGLDVLAALTPRDPQQNPGSPGDTIVTIEIQEE